MVPVIAAHGGCGATTLVRHLVRGSEAVLEIPASGEGATLTGVSGWGRTPLSAWSGAPVLVVGLGTAYGLRQIMDASAELLRVGVDVVVAVVADGVVAEPVPVRARIRTMRGAVRAVVRVPYVPLWRVEDFPTATPPAYAQAVEEIRDAFEQPDKPGKSRRERSNRAQ